MIDFHTHILPNIDDGSKNIEQTLNMVKEAQKIGFNKIIIGCGKIEFNIQIVDENLYSLETSITVSGDTLYNLDFYLHIKYFLLPLL